MQLTTSVQDIMQSVWDAMMMTSQVEVFMFVAGLAGYFLLFQKRSQRKTARRFPKTDTNANDLPKTDTKATDLTQTDLEFLLSLQVAAGNCSEVQNLVRDIQARKLPIVLGEEVLNSMLSDSFFVIGGDMIKLIVEFVKSQSQLFPSTYEVLIKGMLYSANLEEARKIIPESLERLCASSFSMELINSILDFCRHSPEDVCLADELLQRLQPAEWKVLSEFIAFYAEIGEFERACDIYELNFATSFDAELEKETESSLIMAALKCGRLAVAEHLHGRSQQDLTKGATTIQRWWKRKLEELRSRPVVDSVAEALARLSDAFQERFPFQEDSDGESTLCSGDDDDLVSLSDHDCESDW